MNTGGGEVHEILFSGMVLVALLGNLFWYHVMSELRGVGKELRWFGDHFRAYRLLREAIGEAQSEPKRRHFKRLLIAMYVLPVIFFIGFIAVVMTSEIGLR